MSAEVHARLFWFSAAVSRCMRGLMATVELHLTADEASLLGRYLSPDRVSADRELMYIATAFSKPVPNGVLVSNEVIAFRLPLVIAQDLIVCLSGIQRVSIPGHVSAVCLAPNEKIDPNDLHALVLVLEGYLYSEAPLPWPNDNDDLVSYDISGELTEDEMNQALQLVYANARDVALAKLLS